MSTDEHPNQKSSVATDENPLLGLLSDELLAELRESFELFADSGQMSVQHLFSALRSMGVDATDDDVIAVVDDHDPDGRGYITYEQWTAAMARRWSEDDDRRKRFRARLAAGDDEVPTGQVTVDHLRSVLLSYVPAELTATDVNRLMGHYAGRSYVDYDDFMDKVIRPSRLGRHQ